jgi:A/G-specific adenine glycosylase
VTRNQALVAWYEREGRDLPWRGASDPWEILVSEVMSQQTQIARVVERIGPFLEAFPTPLDLAEASPEEAVALWAGLGYLRRLHSLRRAARAIADDGWPDDLTRLPGVGPYTAAAVACFAFGAVVPAVDTNHRRVISRWLGTSLDGTALWEAASELIDPDRAAAWNQAVMDLGADVCRRLPDCGRCPVSRWCADPTVYQAPPRQGRYEGSARQARAAVLRTLAGWPGAGVADLARTTGLSVDRIDSAVETLRVEGMVAPAGAGLRLA